MSLSKDAPFFVKLMENFPISISKWIYWEDECNPFILNSIAQRMINAELVNPWVFTADARHFWQFAEEADLEFFWNEMNCHDRDALFGKWTDDDWEMAK